MSELDVSNNPKLTYLVCCGRGLPELDVSNNPELTFLQCSFNQLSNLKLHNNNALEVLYARANEFKKLDLRNVQNLIDLNLRGNPIEEVCVWTLPFPPDNVHVIPDDIPFTTECTAGINALHNDGDIMIYPNPARTFLIINTRVTDLYYIGINSLNGQLLFSKQMEGALDQIDLSSFRKGVYFITIRSKDFTTTRKIIKL